MTLPRGHKALQNHELELAKSWIANHPFYCLAALSLTGSPPVDYDRWRLGRDDGVWSVRR
jgi:hypothetical protein